MATPSLSVLNVLGVRFGTVNVSRYRMPCCIACLDVASSCA